MDGKRENSTKWSREETIQVSGSKLFSDFSPHFRKKLTCELSGHFDTDIQKTQII